MGRAGASLHLDRRACRRMSSKAGGRCARAPNGWGPVFAFAAKSGSERNRIDEEGSRQTRFFRPAIGTGQARERHQCVDEVCVGFSPHIQVCMHPHRGSKHEPQMIHLQPQREPAAYCAANHVPDRSY